MSRESREKFDAARRRHRQARDLPGFREWISEKTNLGVRFVVHDINHSISIEERAYARLKDLRSTGELSVSEALDEGEFKRLADSVLRPEAATSLLVFLSRWSRVGAIALSGKDLALNLAGLLMVDGDTVTACTADFDRIFSFDVLVEADGTRKFEVDEWRKAGS
jgi:hypothetical protein